MEAKHLDSALRKHGGACSHCKVLRSMIWRGFSDMQHARIRAQVQHRSRLSSLCTPVSLKDGQACAARTPTTYRAHKRDYRRLSCKSGLFCFASAPTLISSGRSFETSPAYRMSSIRSPIKLRSRPHAKGTQQGEARLMERNTVSRRSRTPHPEG